MRNQAESGGDVVDPHSGGVDTWNYQRCLITFFSFCFRSSGSAVSWGRHNFIKLPFGWRLASVVIDGVLGTLPIVTHLTAPIYLSLLVFSIAGGPKQNARSLLTHVSDTVFHALSHGSLHFDLHGSLVNHLFQRFLLAVEENQPINQRFIKLPWRAKPRLPCEGA